jgi:hypothetical protein
VEYIKVALFFFALLASLNEIRSDIIFIGRLIAKQYAKYLETAIDPINNYTNAAVTDAISSINTNTNNKTTELSAKIETAYLGNKKMVMNYCTEIPDPNPRNLFIGCEDYVKEFIKNSVDDDWSTPVYTANIYYWYDENEKLIEVKEED